LLAEVDPARREPFLVRTPRFSVHVLGTRFSVSVHAVRVLEGRVRVVDRDGTELAQLGAGERFEVAKPAKPVQRDAADSQAQARAPSAEPDVQAQHALELEAEPQNQALAAGSARAREVEAPRDRAQQPANSLLARARSELAAGNVGSARSSVNDALGAAPSAAERAEALTLRAECALVEGERAAAARAYLVVADRFDHLPAGENALFAAVRLYGDLGQRELAASLVQRYLTRYPNGRFVSEARRRAAGEGVR
jgi:hypothetical protein